MKIVADTPRDPELNDQLKQLGCRTAPAAVIWFKVQDLVRTRATNRPTHRSRARSCVIEFKSACAG